MPIWEIRDFLDVHGGNVIRDWLDGLPASAQAAIEARLDGIAGLEKLTRPYTGNLGGGIYEVRLEHKNVQYRPLFCYGPGQHVLTLLMGAVERDSQLVPRGAYETAVKRMGKALDDPNRTCEHEV